MHHHSTKQRLAALRRRLGIQLTPPNAAGERARKHDAAAVLEAAHEEAAAAMRAAREASRKIVEALTPAPGLHVTPASIRGLVAALTPAPSRLLATAGGPDPASEAPTRIAPAPYPSQHLAAPGPEAETDAGGPSARAARGAPARWGWLALALLVGAVIAGRLALSGAAKPAAQGSAPTERPVDVPPAVRTAPPPPPLRAPAPAPAPAPRRVTVSRGDSLWRLSAAHLGDPEGWRRLHELNRAAIRDPDLIYPGQVFELP